MRLKQLLQERADLIAENGRILKGADGRSLTAEERQRSDAILARLEELRDEIAREERQRELERTVAPVQDANAAAHQRSEQAAGVTVSVRDRSEDDPARGFRTPREFITAVMQHGMGRRMDDRLRPLFQAAAGSDEAGAYSDPHGGFLVPAAFIPSLQTTEPEDIPIPTRQIPMSAAVVRMPARVDKNHSTSVSGGLTVTRKPETQAGTSSRMQFEQITLTAYSLFGLSYATEEILTDSPVSFAALIASGFRDEFASARIKECLNGSGVGEFLGIMNSPALVTVAKESGQTADTINGTNIMKMRSRAYRYSRSFWYANHDTLPELVKAHISGTNGDVFIFAPGNGVDKPDTLLGRPIYFTEYTAKLGDLGDIVLVDWSEYLEGTYQPLQSAESVHVRFLEHERTFKFWLRNAGAPWWSTALTPHKGANTLSPFVALAERA